MHVASSKFIVLGRAVKLVIQTEYPIATRIVHWFLGNKLFSYSILIHGGGGGNTQIIISQDRVLFWMKCEFMIPRVSQKSPIILGSKVFPIRVKITSSCVVAFRNNRNDPKSGWWGSILLYTSVDRRGNATRHSKNSSLLHARAGS